MWSQRCSFATHWPLRHRYWTNEQLQLTDSSSAVAQSGIPLQTSSSLIHFPSIHWYLPSSHSGGLTVVNVLTVFIVEVKGSDDDITVGVNKIRVSTADAGNPLIMVDATADMDVVYGYMVAKVSTDVENNESVMPEVDDDIVKAETDVNGVQVALSLEDKVSCTVALYIMLDMNENELEELIDELFLGDDMDEILDEIKNELEELIDEIPLVDDMDKTRDVIKNEVEGLIAEIALVEDIEETFDVHNSEDFVGTIVAYVGVMVGLK